MLTKPVNEAGKKPHTGTAKIKIVAYLGTNTNTLEEVCATISELDTYKSLAREGHTSDFRPTKLWPLEAIQIA